MTKSEDSHVLAAVYVSDLSVVRQVGAKIFQTVFGRFPPPHDFNKKGRPRILIADKTSASGYRKVLVDDLMVIGWYAEALSSLCAALNEIHLENEVRVDFIVDRLPRDPELKNASLLAKVVAEKSDGLASVVGVPARSDRLPRDLFVDNLAGLGRELSNGTWKGNQEARDVFRINRAVRLQDLNSPNAV